MTWGSNPTLSIGRKSWAMKASFFRVIEYIRMTRFIFLKVVKIEEKNEFQNNNVKLYISPLMENKSSRDGKRISCRHPSYSNAQSEGCTYIFTLYPSPVTSL